MLVFSHIKYIQIDILTDDEPIALMALNAINIPTFTDRAQPIQPMMFIKKEIRYILRRPIINEKRNVGDTLHSFILYIYLPKRSPKGAQKRG